jgi:hypothetical protein
VARFETKLAIAGVIARRCSAGKQLAGSNPTPPFSSEMAPRLEGAGILPGHISATF